MYDKVHRQFRVCVPAWTYIQVLWKLLRWVELLKNYWVKRTSQT